MCTIYMHESVSIQLLKERTPSKGRGKPAVALATPAAWAAPARAASSAS